MLNFSKLPKIPPKYPKRELYRVYFYNFLEKENFVKNSVKKIVPFDVKYSLLYIFTPSEFAI
jgi:hypothetical protein